MILTPTDLFDTDKIELENKIPDTSGLVKRLDYNAKINEKENKMPSISGLAINDALTVIEKKISNINSLVKKKRTDYSTKITEIEKLLTDHNHDKYITTPEFSKPSAEDFDSRLAQAHLVTKTDFDDKLENQNQKIKPNKTQHLLVENELKKLKKIDSSYFRGKNHFEEDGTQNYLVFQPIVRYSKVNTIMNVAEYILSWKSKGLSAESIKLPATSDNSLTPALSYYDDFKVRVKFTGSCLE